MAAKIPFGKYGPVCKGPNEGIIAGFPCDTGGWTMWVEDTAEIACDSARQGPHGSEWTDVWLSESI